MNTMMVIILILFKILSALTLSVDDDLSIIRQRVLEQMIWPPADTIPTVVENASMYARTLNSSCYWPDVNYSDPTHGGWLTATHMSRVTTMVQALTVNGSSERNNTNLLDAAHCALNVWLIRDWQSQNWWWNRISIPIMATSVLLMLDKNITNFELEKIKEISFRANWWNGDRWTTSANLVWMIQSQIYRSLATQNLTGLAQGFNRMWQDIVVEPADKEGLQIDYSYHFHGSQLLSGAYGEVWADNILSFFMCSFQTKYSPDTDKLILFAEALTKGYAWMIIGQEWDWHVIGREIARPDREYMVIYDPRIIRFLAEVIPSMDLQNELRNFADRLDNLPNATLLIGNKHFYRSDYLVHRRVNWTAAIKMQSNRTMPDECGNSENTRSEHTGQGVLNLYRTNIDDYVYVYPLFDWQALNGITVEHDIPLKICTDIPSSLIKLPFVGGVSDGFYGLAMMDTATHNLTAKRSWHFYDDAIIALASNLTLTTSNIAWTTLASRILRTRTITVAFFNSTIMTLTDGNYSFPYSSSDKASNVQWIHISDTDFAYLLQQQGLYSSIGIDLGIKTGNFDNIGPHWTPVTDRTLTIWIDHGRGPYTLDYNYMILPNVSLESIPTIIKQYDEEQVFSCQSTNNLFHGTMWPKLRRASFVLWDNIPTTFSCNSSLFQINIQLNEAGAYLFSETDIYFTITVAQPLRFNSTIKVTVDRYSYGQGCTTVSHYNQIMTDVTLALPSSNQFLGASVNTTCTKLGNRY